MLIPLLNVSVLPHSVIAHTLHKQPDRYPNKAIIAFGGIQVNLKSPVKLMVEVGKTRVNHPFYFTMAQTPNIVGYDLMKTLGLVLDTPRDAVWLRPNINQSHLEHHNYNSMVGGESITNNCVP